MKVREIFGIAGKRRLAATRVSHRQFKQELKKGRVTVAGHPNDDVHPKTEKSILTQVGVSKE